VHWQITALWGGKKSGIARDPASRHPVRWAGGVLGVSEARWLTRSREQVWGKFGGPCAFLVASIFGNASRTGAHRA
jgi:cobalamin biosynthesis protein CobD/CbiB